MAEGDIAALQNKLAQIMERIVASYDEASPKIHHLDRMPLPTREDAAAILEAIEEVIYPGYYSGGGVTHLAVLGFSLYVELVAGFEEVYGALGGIFGFLFLVYLVASALVIGAEVVGAWALAAQPKLLSGPRQPLGRRLVEAARSLVFPQSPRQ